jgi:F0F1-type ATP synthase membrane subunit c/vacuolar-type H+-ATPase subunit K
VWRLLFPGVARDLQALAAVAAAGVAVSASGVGERIIAASLARAAGMQLQMTAHTQIQPLAVWLLQRSILTQRGPWDAGMLAVRVGIKSGGETSSDSSYTSSSGDSRSSEDEAVHFEGAGAAGAAACDEPDPGAPDAGGKHQGQQQQQQQRRLCVELAAVFTSPSFAVGWMTTEPEAALQVEVLRNDGQRPAAAAAAAAPEEAPGGGMLQQQQQPAALPQVKCMAVCCSWPLA